MDRLDLIVEESSQPRFISSSSRFSVLPHGHFPDFSKHRSADKGSVLSWLETSCFNSGRIFPHPYDDPNSKLESTHKSPLFSWESHARDQECDPARQVNRRTPSPDRKRHRSFWSYRDTMGNYMTEYRYQLVTDLPPLAGRRYKLRKTTQRTRACWKQQLDKADERAGIQKLRGRREKSKKDRCGSELSISSMDCETGSLDGNRAGELPREPGGWEQDHGWKETCGIYGILS